MLSLVWLRYDRLCCNETQKSEEMSTEALYESNEQLPYCKHTQDFK